IDFQMTKAWVTDPLTDNILAEGLYDQKATDIAIENDGTRKWRCYRSNNDIDGRKTAIVHFEFLTSTSEGMADLSFRFLGTDNPNDDTSWQKYAIKSVLLEIKN
ncbi:MAG: hypothetical protein AAF203_00730, partial [Pseudomonadota bacterium]